MSEPAEVATAASADQNGKWYAEVTRYQWLVLIIASAGWVFDQFESQVFNITRKQMLTELLGGNSPADVAKWGDWFLAIFLLGGALGGIVFGSIADRVGRKPAMTLSILCYSVFSGLTFFASSLWQVAALRFLVALGVGGEWTVAAAIVSEVFPAKARAHASGIFHATSVLGTWLAALAGMAVSANWRYAYVLGIAPALLVLWVRSGLKEPESWEKSVTESKRGGSLKELFVDPRWRKRAILGMLLATIGLGTFWGVIVAGQDLTDQILRANGVDKDTAAQKAKFAYGIVQTAGGGLGLVSFGWLAAALGRKRAFALMHVLGFLIVPVVCYWPKTYGQLLPLLPIFGFLTLAIHAGYAIYFPELFPSRLRATGAGFCFNGGRILSGAILILSGKLKGNPAIGLQNSMMILSCLFLLGLVVLIFLPETKDQPLPE